MGVLMHRRGGFKPVPEAEWNQPNILTVMHWALSILCIISAADDCQVCRGAGMPTVGTVSFIEPHSSCSFSCVGKGCLQEIGHRH